MIQLILGRAGSGKTTKLNEILAEKANGDVEIIFLTPEQFSFETEKSLYRLLGGEKSRKVKVLSFTRLCYEIFKKYGGMKTQLTDMQKQLLMAVTLSELNEELTVYNSYKKNASFIASMVDTMDDFKAAAVSDGDLYNASKLCEEKELSQKLEDLSIIFTAYNAIAERCGADPKDNLVKAIKKAQENGFFRDKFIFIDSFMAFSPGEHNMIDLMVQQAGEIYGAFCISDLGGNEEVFLPVSKTLRKIMSKAREWGVEVKNPIVLTGQFRFTHSALGKVEREFLSEHISEETEDFEERVKCIAGVNPYGEIMYIASQIKKLVINEGYRYGEIAFITREFTRYEKILPQIFEKFGIPYYMDRRIDISVSPIVIGLKAVLDCAVNNFSTENLLKFAKSPVSKLKPFETSVLDNYCYTWNIRGEMWKRDFTANPNSLSSNLSEEDVSLLEQINGYRKIIIEPILRFKRQTENACGREFAEALYELLSSFDVFEGMKEFSADMAEGERQEFLDLQGAVWENLMDILDLFSDIIGENKMSLRTYNELLVLCINNCDLGQIPQTLDHVIVGKADRIRPDKIRAAFVAGCVTEEFPKQISAGGILSDNERNTVQGLGLTLTADVEERESYENHYAYFALTRASERLYVSYPAADLTGKSLTPSVIFSEVLEIGNIRAISSDGGDKRDYVWNISTAMEAFGENFGLNDTFKSTLMKFITDRKKTNIISKMESAGERPKHSINDLRLARDIFGENMRISPTRLDEFYTCKFAYFAKNGLKIKERQKADISAIETGRLIHYVMENMVKKYGREMIKLSEEELYQGVKAVQEEYVRSEIDEKNLTPRVKYLFERVNESLLIIIRHLARELAQSEFIPTYFEEKIGDGGRFKSLIITGEDGSKITVEGKVDRIDIMEKGGKKYVRVIDYKSGTKKFNLSDVYFGLNMQMLIYLFAICPECEPQSEMQPAGILYMPSKNTISSVKANMSEREIESVKDESLKMSGLVLKEQAVIFAMERAGEGIFIPVKMKNGEADRYSSVATLNEMKKLKKIVEKNIKEMQNILHRGNVEAFPAVSADSRPCDYCIYNVACGHMETDGERKIYNISKEKIFGGEE